MRDKYFLYFFLILMNGFIFFPSISEAIITGNFKTSTKSTSFNDRVLSETFQNIEQKQKEMSVYRKKGENQYGFFVSLLLVLCTICTGLVAIIEGSKIWKKTNPYRLWMLLVLSILATLFSSTSLYLKSENDRFYKENRHKYIELSLDMKNVIRNFMSDFNRGKFNDETMKKSKIKNEFIELSDKMYDSFLKLEIEYNTKYGLNTDPDV